MGFKIRYIYIIIRGTYKNILRNQLSKKYPTIQKISNHPTELSNTLLLFPTLLSLSPNIDNLLSFFLSILPIPIWGFWCVLFDVECDNGLRIFFVNDAGLVNDWESSKY